MPGLRSLLLVTLVGASVLPVPAAAEESGAACNGVPATHLGTDGADVLIGTAGPDVFVGRGGDDTIRGRGGDDLICGGPGDDALYGGPGADFILGASGADTIYGGGDADTLRGGGGDDLIDGGPGNDEISGWSGFDELVGGRGDDRLEGQSGDDDLEGGRHNDVLIGGEGIDTLTGGPGADLCDGENLATCDIRDLARGDSGNAVSFLQRGLSGALLYRGPIDGVFDEGVEAAVIAFHKVTGPRRSSPAAWKADPPSGNWSLDDWLALDGFRPVPPKQRPGEPDRVEVDIGHQVLYVIDDNRTIAILPVSTGGGYTYIASSGGVGYAWTPRGNYRLLFHQLRGSTNPSVYKPWFFRLPFAVHGYHSVPPWPASHGCVRVHHWEADWLWTRLRDGMPIHVWDS